MTNVDFSSRPHPLRRALRGVTAVYLTGLFIATHIPVPEELAATMSADKLLHFAAYFVLAVLLSASLLGSRPTSTAALGGLFVVVLAYAAIDEVLQMFVGRVGDIADWGADAAGAAAGVLTYLGVIAKSRGATATDSMH